MIRNYLLVCLLTLLAACQGVTVYSPAEIESGYTYVPLDPFPVTPTPGSTCPNGIHLTRETLLEALPDNAVRMLTEQFDASGAVTYGPSKVQGKGESYRVTIDYIYSDTINRRIYVSKSVMPTPSAEDVRDRIHPEPRVVPINAPPTFSYIKGSETYTVTTRGPTIRLYPDTPTSPDEVERRRMEEEKALEKARNFARDFTEFNIPVYVGLGLRTSTTIYAAKANANISGLGIIGAEAESNNLKGSLIIQTLGVNGKSVAAALPIQSELNRTTAQNAIVAIGTIKALLHSPETWIAPRVVGLYLPFPGGKALVNALISELSRDQIEWSFTCFAPSKQNSNKPS